MAISLVHKLSKYDKALCTQKRLLKREEVPTCSTQLFHEENKNDIRSHTEEYEEMYKADPNMVCLNPNIQAPYIISRWENTYVKLSIKNLPSS